MTRQLSEHERGVILSAMRSAIITYRQIAAAPETVASGLVDQFEQQAHEADYLAGMLEEVESITISNEVSA